MLAYSKNRGRAAAEDERKRYTRRRVGRTPRNVELTILYVKNIFMRAQRLLGRAFATGNVQTRGPLRDTGAVTLTAWQSDDELCEVNRVIGLLSDRMKPSRHSAGKRLINLTLDSSLIHPERGNRG